MPRFTRLVLALAGAALITSCGGDNGNPANASGNNAKGTLSATIDGASWTASATVLAVRTPALPNLPSGTVAVNGTNAFSNYTLVTIAVPAVVGTYQVGPSTIANAAVDFITTSSDSKWTSGTAPASGTIKLDTLTSTGASGTFSFNLLPLAAPATGTKVVTNGVFNVKF